MDDARDNAATIIPTLRRLLADERGLETVEFAIIIGLITAGAIAALTAIGIWVAAQFTSVQTQLMA